MRAPCAGVPAPGGKPVPSGATLISHAAISAGSIGLPRPGPSADATLAARQSISPTAGDILLGVDMFDLPVAVDPPAGDGVEVLIQHCPDRRNCLELTALGDEFGSGRLHVAGIVPGAALQGRGPAVPMPGHAEAGEGLAEYRLRQTRLGPAFAAVGRYHDLGDPAGAGIGDAGDLVEPRPRQIQPRRRLGDERLDLLQQIELVRLAVRQDRCIDLAFPIAYGRFRDEL